MYKLEPITYTEPMVFITLEGDMNDGDYIDAKTSLAKDEFDKIYPLFREFLQMLKENRYLGTMWQDRGEPEPQDWQMIFEELQDIINMPYEPYDYGLCHSVSLKELMLVGSDGKQYLILIDNL